MPEYASQTNPYVFAAICLAWPVVMLFMGAWKAFFEPVAGAEK